MNTLRKLRKSTKALSPVVASIILIAVTVAVSIAVAAWMGALTVGFMSTEQVKITNVAFGGTAPLNVTVTIQNTGSSSVTIGQVYFANVLQAEPLDWEPDAAKVSIAANAAATVSFAPTAAWEAGSQYMIKIVTSQGNPFTYTAIAPY